MASGSVHLTTTAKRGGRRRTVTLCGLLARDLPLDEIAVEPSDVECEACDKVAWGELPWPQDEAK